jgi:ABC-type microcin C transport system permease subunit YejB
MEPDSTLNFELGETIYENHKVTEWIKFWKVLSVTTLGLWPAFYTFEIYNGDGAPSLSWLADVGNWW